MNNAGVLTASGIGIRVAKDYLFQNISLEVIGGQTLAISGPSGSGKTSLLHALACLIPLDQGSVSWNKVPVKSGDSLPVHMGLILQTYGLIPFLTVEENLLLPLKSLGSNSPQTSTDIRNTLETLNLQKLSGKLVTDLSGGQRQRVAVARALLANPLVFIADEPTAELDPDNREVVLEKLFEKVATGAMLIIASHDPAVLERCDSVISLS